MFLSKLYMLACQCIQLQIYMIRYIEERCFIIYIVMKNRKILIKYNAYFEKAVFHLCENTRFYIFMGEKS